MTKGSDAGLRVAELTRRFGAAEAVSSLSFVVEPGALVGLLGPNGSGKTTTLHLLIGLLEPTAGTVRIDGRSPSEPEVRRTVGVLPDDLPLPGALTGTELLDLHDRLRGLPRSALRDELTDLFDLDRHLHRPLSDYSHGMKRKTQIVAAVAHRPTYLLLDEPYRGLDPEAVVILRDLIDALRRSGTGVLLATHDIARAGEICDRVVVIHHGQQLAFAPPGELCRRTGTTGLEPAFLALTGLDDQLASARSRVNDAVDALSIG